MGDAMRKFFARACRHAGTTSASLALAIFAASPAQAEPSPPAVRAEILALLQRIQTQSCEVNRNGKWHSAQEAATHLTTKLGHIERDHALHSAEQFIAEAATRSSLSGQAYALRCASSNTMMESGPWLTAQLKAMRAARSAKAASS